MTKAKCYKCGAVFVHRKRAKTHIMKYGRSGRLIRTTMDGGAVVDEDDTAPEGTK